MQTQVKNDIGDYLIESVLKTVNGATSPVAGEDWAPLSKEYKKKKREEGGTGKADMQLEGDMLDALTFEPTKDGIDLGFFGEEAWKADGHLKFSGKENNTPKRRFLPGEGQLFDGAIQEGANRILADAIADNAPFKESDFNAVNTKAELYEVLGEFFEGMSRPEILAAVTRSETLSTLLDELGILNLL